MMTMRYNWRVGGVVEMEGDSLQDTTGYNKQTIKYWDMEKNMYSIQYTMDNNKII